MIEDFEHSVDEFDINVHGVFVEAVIEVLSELFVLGLSVGGVLKIVLEKGSLKNVFGLDYVNRQCWFHLF
jgi:hypothetical protein